MNAINSLVNKLSGLTSVEVAELAKKLEEKWGVKAARPVMPSTAVTPKQAAPVEEQTSFEVVLKTVGGNKIGVIKEVRAAIKGLGLAEAKALVEAAPKTLVLNVSKAEAADIKQKVEAAGASVEIR